MINELERNDLSLKIKKKKHLKKPMVIIVIVLITIIAVAIGLRESILFKSKTTKLGFEDIGELATQSSYCTELGVIDDSRKLFGVKIPFTQTKYIYSYDVVVKAGLNFNDIEWTKNENKIEVKLPEVKVLSTEINLDSFKVYHEDESIFNQVTLEENNEEIKKLKERATEDAIANGLLDNARNNAEVILKGFFSKADDLKNCEISFENK
ncbi:Protein of unknown function [Clostridium sp. DSM 8431]|uniref:DUF4230 domain-containing protein n=1 Tax=Clostridium sp. DSM 8431 TaxID=1761781 RepID=UPI0008DF0778|nr:DUF4230 domain-containing protein [Clostridium sp. DSM 8431]SFU56153.1 Protein of unknown function [Clostridium sp. DSM 8431]